MIKLIKIDPKNLPYYVKQAFEGDIELLEQYHISPGTLDHCVNHTMGFINENAAFYKADIEFYAVVKDVETTIGYTIGIRNEGKPNELYSFGINIKYRQKEILQDWLAEVEKLLGTPYFMVLWSKNERAINFFENNGFIVQRTSKLLEDETKTLIIHNK